MLAVFVFMLNACGGVSGGGVRLPGINAGSDAELKLDKISKSHIKGYFNKGAYGLVFDLTYSSYPFKLYGDIKDKNGSNLVTWNYSTDGQSKISLLKNALIITPNSITKGLSYRGDKKSIAKLMKNKSVALLPYLSAELGLKKKITGKKYRVVQPLYKLAMSIAKTNNINPVNKSLNAKALTSPGKCNNCDARKDSCSPGNCLGMCGKGCNCWSWVCGNCCCNSGCLKHDKNCQRCAIDNLGAESIACIPCMFFDFGNPVLACTKCSFCPKTGRVGQPGSGSVKVCGKAWKCAEKLADGSCIKCIPKEAESP